MKKLLIAAAAVLGAAGVASAQQAPFLYGNYSPDVIEAYNTGRVQVSTDADLSSRAFAVDNVYSTDHGIVSAQSAADLRSGQ